MDRRQQEGALIAATSKLKRCGYVWQVPSSSGNGKYSVSPDEQAPYCSCLDFETRGVTCKHIHAVRFTIQRDKDASPQEPLKDREPVTDSIKRKTYKQKWPEYNAAQTNEKRHFQELLSDLCAGLTPQQRVSKGRPFLPLCDAVFSAVFKIYSTLSGRRFMTDLKSSQAEGFIGKLPSYNSIFRYLENQELTQILTDLIIKAASPLRTVESSFAIDSSGFSGSKFVKWFDQKYGGLRHEHTWVKAHICVGVNTQVVAAVEIHEKTTNDCPLLPSLLKTTAKTFEVREVSADKQYASELNFQAINDRSHQ